MLIIRRFFLLKIRLRVLNIMIYYQMIIYVELLVAFLGSISFENSPFVFELVLFCPHLLLAVAISPIFMQI